MTTAEQLRAAKALIDTPDKWTKNATARDADGKAVRPLSARAVCWCGFGALVKACGNTAAAHLRAFESFNGSGNIAGLNDREGTAHADVMAMFDRAIALAEQPS